MAVDLIDGGDTEEDEAVAHVVKANPKQRAQLERPGPGKAKQQRDRGKGKRDCRQQSDRETRLYIILVYQLTNFFRVVFFSTSTLPQ